MRVINIMFFIMYLLCLCVYVVPLKSTSLRWKQCREQVKKYMHLATLLVLVNTISFAMTYTLKNSEIYVEKGNYGEEEYEIPFLLEKEDSSREITVDINARKFTEKELKEKINEAFLYLEKNMKGENSSLSEIRDSLNYSLDYKRFPFDVEFVSEDHALIDRDGTVNNKKEDLNSLGYTEDEIKKGIPTKVEVTLWYEERSFKKTFFLKVFSREKTELEEAFDYVKNEIVKAEEAARHKEGFYIPMTLEGVKIRRLDEETITPEKVLFAGIIIVVLLILRDYENKQVKMKNRKENLLRSYPWFVNEVVLLMGAGMQVKNVFSTIISDYEKGIDTKDYRKPLIEELKVAVHAMNLGMTEEQAYYRLGRRIGLSCYIKIMTLLEQNVKRGAKGLSAVLEQEELQALEERKNLAKRYGEEAGTKLLGPMILLLLVVMLMIMIPALWSFA